MHAIKSIVLAAIVVSGTSFMPSAVAQDQGAGAGSSPDQGGGQPVGNPQQVYGAELMTEQERNEHREKMRSMKTEEERNAYRAQHHEEMQQRARERGLTLPDEPPGQGQGKGRGYGSDKPCAGPCGGKGGGKGSSKGG